MAPSTAITEATQGTAIEPSRLARYGLFALLLVCLVNGLVLFVGLALFEFPSAFVGGAFGPLATVPVLVNSAIATVGATIVYGAVTRFATRPNRTFTIIAGGVLLLSFAMFLAPDLSDAPARVFAILAVMHVTTAVVIVGVLTKTADQEDASG